MSGTATPPTPVTDSAILVVVVSCQLDRIWNHLEDGLLGTPVGYDLDYTDVGNPLKCGLDHSLGRTSWTVQRVN